MPSATSPACSLCPGPSERAAPGAVGLRGNATAATTSTAAATRMTPRSLVVRLDRRWRGRGRMRCWKGLHRASRFDGRRHVHTRLLHDWLCALLHDWLCALPLSCRPLDTCAALRPDIRRHFERPAHASARSKRWNPLCHGTWTPQCTCRPLSSESLRLGTRRLQNGYSTFNSARDCPVWPAAQSHARSSHGLDKRVGGRSGGWHPARVV